MDGNKIEVGDYVRIINSNVFHAVQEGPWIDLYNEVGKVVEFKPEIGNKKIFFVYLPLHDSIVYLYATDIQKVSNITKELYI